MQLAILQYIIASLACLTKYTANLPSGPRIYHRMPSDKISSPVGFFTAQK